MRKSMVVSLFLAAGAAPLSLAQGALGLERYDGQMVVRVEPADETQAAFVRGLGADLWSHREGPASEYRVNAEQLDALRRRGVKVDVLVDNVQRLIDAERSIIEAPRGLGGYFEAYHRYEDMKQFADDLSAANPAMVTRLTAGQSLEGREMFALKITAPGGASGKPAIVFSAMQHAREWISGTTALYLADRLVAGYGADPEITAALDAVDVYIVPVMNPDGYIWTWDVERLWRKNRRANVDGSRGVDTNRNFSIGWGLNGGSSASPNNDTFRGVSPFSEPESTALANFIQSIPRVRAHVDLHSYSELVLSPWGWTEAPCDDAAAYDSLNASLRDAIAGVHGRVYTVGPAGSTLYIASGTAPDWSYGELGVFGWTIELRPSSASAGGFVLPPSEIIPTGEEIMPALLLLADFAADDIYFFGERLPSYVDAANGAEVRLNATPTPGNLLDTNAGALRYRFGDSGPFASAPLTFDLSGGVTAQLPGGPCGRDAQFYVEVAVDGGGVSTFPAGGAASPLSVPVRQASVSFDDDFAADLGWTIGAVGDNATTGVWTRGVPNATNYQPGSGDPNGSGGACFYTGYSDPGASDGANDIDGGITTLTSPVFDATQGGEAYLAYSRWLGSNGTPGNDSLRAFLSNDAGATWIQVDALIQDARQWERREIRIADFLAPTASMRVRFIAADAGSASVSEAAVDDVRIVSLGCPALLGDIDGDGSVNFADLNAVLSAFGLSGEPGFNAADIDGDGDVDFGDLNAVLSNFGAGS